MLWSVVSHQIHSYVDGIWKVIRFIWSHERRGDTGDIGLIPGSGKSPGEENGRPLQYSCLGNPMDRRSWLVIVHGVASSWAWLWLNNDNLMIIIKSKNLTTPFLHLVYLQYLVFLIFFLYIMDGFYLARVSFLKLLCTCSQLLSHVRLFTNPWVLARQTLSMEFSS